MNIANTSHYKYTYLSYNNIKGLSSSWRKAERSPSNQQFVDSCSICSANWLSLSLFIYKL